MKTRTMLVLLTLWFCGQSPVLAQMPIGGQSQADIFKLISELPPDVIKKVQEVGKILQQDLKEGKLTQTQIQEELMSGNLDQKIRDLNPEAGPLLDDIAQAMKNHPNADNLPRLLDGLAGFGR
jgi:hypothetical protein